MLLFLLVCNIFVRLFPCFRYLFIRGTNKKKCAICVELYGCHNIISNKHQGDIESYHQVRARACKEVNDRESINAKICVCMNSYKSAQIFDVRRAIPKQERGRNRERDHNLHNLSTVEGKFSIDFILSLQACIIGQFNIHLKEILSNK